MTSLLRTPPIPSPSPSPAAERIVVELSNSEGSTALTTAIIAAAVAVVVALLSHTTTRKREHEKWFRERLFDTAQSVLTAHREFHDAVWDGPNLKVPKLDAEERTEVIYEWVWYELDKPAGRYRDALKELQLLTKDKHMQFLVSKVRDDVLATTSLIRKRYDRPSSRRTAPTWLPSRLEGEALIGLNESLRKLLHFMTIAYFEPSNRRLLSRTMHRFYAFRQNPANGTSSARNA